MPLYLLLLPGRTLGGTGEQEGRMGGRKEILLNDNPWIKAAIHSGDYFTNMLDSRLSAPIYGKEVNSYENIFIHCHVGEGAY